MTIATQFLFFNVYFFIWIGLAALLFSVFGGTDFELRKSMGRACLVAWSVALLVRVFVIQNWLIKKFDQQSKK